MDDGQAEGEGYSLFEQEERIIAMAEDMVEKLGHVADGVRALADAYRQGYREQRRLVRLSDRMQLQLQEANRRLEEQAIELHRLAITDPLTRLYTRGHFMELAAHEAKRCRADGLPLSVLVIDMDHFKSINDTWGHATGDAALIAFAEICRSELDALDIVARLGGEEFALVLPGTDIGAATRCAVHLRQTLAQLTIEGMEPGYGVTASIGVASLRRDEDSIERALSRADQALYQAKAAGRNCVTVHDHTHERRGPCALEGS